MINVIIPAYNCSATLGRTLASLAAQTDTDFEVILVDDCSTENIKPIVEEYSSRLKLRYIRHEYNQGCGMSRQTGIDNATATHFMFCDADDIVMPYTVELFNTFIKDDPEIELICSCFYEQAISKVDKPAYLLRHDGFTWCHGKLYKAEVIKQLGIRNDPSIKWADDTYFNSICCELMKMVIIPQPTYIWTNTPTSAVRKKDSYRDSMQIKDLLNALTLSCVFVKRHKERIVHLEKSIEWASRYIKPDTEEAEMLEQLRKYI